MLSNASVQKNNCLQRAHNSTTFADDSGNADSGNAESGIKSIPYSPNQQQCMNEYSHLQAGQISHITVGLSTKEYLELT